jgi:hypothetical protein
VVGWSGGGVTILQLLLLAKTFLCYISEKYNA